MATVRGKAQVAVGSAKWIAKEKEQVAQAHGQEFEDFAFLARDEMEWLNEHMAEIFSKDDLNVTEIYKSPAKLRGKTPRTTRKRNPLEARAPLTDIFSTNVVLNNGPPRSNPFAEKVGRLQSEQGTTSPNQEAPRLMNYRSKANTDSGYQTACHGVSEDEMDVDENMAEATMSAVTHITPLDTKEMHMGPADIQHREQERVSANHRTTDGSFHSARENLISRDLQNIETITVGDQLTDTAAVSTTDMRAINTPLSDSLHKSPQHPVVADDEKDTVFEDDHELDVSNTPSDGSSPAKPLLRKSSLTFASLPAREPLTTTKSIGMRPSRTSNLDQAKAVQLNRNSYLGRLTGGKSLGSVKQADMINDDLDEVQMDTEVTSKPALAREESDHDGAIARLHSKSSTQSLQERINRLTQTQPGRLQKFGASTAIPSNQPAYPELPKGSPESQQEVTSRNRQADKVKSGTAAVNVDDDGEWIKPPVQKLDLRNQPEAAKDIPVHPMERKSGDLTERNTRVPANGAKNVRVEPSASRPFASCPEQEESLNLHQPDQHYRFLPHDLEPSQQGSFPQKFVSVSIPDQSTMASTTPSGSPPRRLHHEVNASKSKLQSIMKSARGLFTSSAGVSAQAKMETLSHNQNYDGSNGNSDVSDPNHSLYPSLSGDLELPLQSNLPGTDEGRRTRSSSEKEQKRKEIEAKGQQGTGGELEGRRDHSYRKICTEETNQLASAVSSSGLRNNAVEVAIQRETKPVRQSPRRQQNCEETGTHAEEEKNATKLTEEQAPAPSMGPPPPRSNSQQSHLQKGKNTRRPIKPTKDVAPKPKPQPVAIRFGTLLGLSQRTPLTNAALSSGLQDSLPPQQSRHPAITKKSSNTSLQASASSFKSSSSSLSSKPKSLIAAERLRKKEQDEKSAQRKAEDNREAERKRLAQQEDAENREQQRRQETERLHERERAAAAAAEARKAASRAAVEKKKPETINKMGQKDVHGLSLSMQPEKSAPAGPASRPDLGPGKPLSRPNMVQDFPRAPNGFPAPNPAKPPIKRVFEPDDEDDLFRPARIPTGQIYQANDSKRRRTEDEDVLEAPVRSINAPPLRQSNIRKDGPKTSIFGNSYNATNIPATNHQAGPSSMKSAALNQSYQQHPYHNQGSRPAHPLDMARYTSGKIPFAEAPNPPPANHKTPLPSKQGTAIGAKSSPSFPQGDHIQLEEIATDSDEEDSDVEKERKKNLPEWVLTPNLDEKLREQERLNPDVLFGPIAPLVMEEIFKDKNRHHRFRSRTSSANWFGQDKLTEEEVRADNAARERLRREGGWTFGL